MAGIEIINLEKSYQVENRKLPVLTGINLRIPERQITVVLGKSGCGKTTLLRLTGGLETADSGEIRYEGSHRTAFVFQEPRLMPWLNVKQNILFGLRGKEKKESGARADEIIRTVGLSGFEQAYPAQLSGGMKQRTALARALAYRPSFIMMDEPFAALDHFTREQMQRELLRVQKTEHCSILFVTHSIDEALLLGNKIVVIEKGKVKKEHVLEETGERNLLDEKFIGLKREIISDLNETEKQ
ncbi:MAG TPA: ABC transporter ATP-binding protein [Candidatus Lachnoclostridium pullistercoris]|uniref:ABC transporter ATP-binding protein n=1 Tax=Candidatus Lachnoclostridium pullistercoris TaxID=2838632 RepID=A0A9D2T6A1_9FIRM|nr:ABC transporter ATP-binding protein [Candidatus Lachnoclostridium pullistercoris]